MFVEGRRRRATTGGRSSASQAGLRGACCSDCAGLGDDEATTVQRQLLRDWVALLGLGMGMVSMGALVFAADKRSRR